MSISETYFLNRPVANVPFITTRLLKLHHRIVTIFQPLDANANFLWEMANRVGTLFSALFVYPGLGILMLASYVSLKSRVKKIEKDAVLTLVNREFASTKACMNDVVLRNRYWWLVETHVFPRNPLLPFNHPSSIDDFRGDYKFLDSDFASSQGNDLTFLKEIENSVQNSVKAIASKNFQLEFKFVIVEKNDDNTFNLYSYDRKIEHIEGFEKAQGGFQSNTLVPLKAATYFLKEGLQIMRKCPFNQI